MRYGQHAALEVLQRLGKRCQGVVVEVVGGLVQRDDVGVDPHRCGQHQTRLLSPGHSLDLAHGEVLVDSELLQVQTDLLLGQRPEVHARLHRLELLVKVANHLHDVLVLLHERRDGLPLGVLVLAAAPSALVEQGLAALLATDDLADVAALHRLLELILGEVVRRPLGDLLVAAQVEAVLQVLQRRVFDALLEVVHGVLRDVREAQVMVLPHLPDALVGRELADQQLHQGRLARAVGADERCSRILRDLHVGVGENLAVGAGVGERHLFHVHHALVPGLDALQRAGLGEANGLDVSRLVVADGVKGVLHRSRRFTSGRPVLIQRRQRGDRRAVSHLGEVGVATDALDLLDGVVRRRQRGDNLGLEALKILEAHGVVGQVLIVEVNDVGEDVREEVVVVRHQADGGVREGLEVVGEPGDRGGVQVVGGLVEEQDLGVPEHRPRDGQLHPPPSGERLDRRRHLHVVEANLLQGVHHGIAADALGNHLDHEVDDGLLLFAENLVLDVIYGDVGGEARDVLRRYAVQQRRLAGAVLSDDAVRLSALQREVGALEKHPAGEGEDDTLEIDDVVLLLVVEKRRGVEALVLQHRALRRGLELILVHHTLEQREQLVLHVVGEDRGRDSHRSGLDDPSAERSRVRLGLGVDAALDGFQSLHDARRGILPVTARALALEALKQAPFRLGGALAEIGVRVFLALLQLGLEARDEGVQVSNVVDEGADVAARHRGFLFELLGPLAQSSEDDGEDDGEARRVHGVDESRLHQLIEASLRLLLGLPDGVHDEVEHPEHLGILHAPADGLHDVARERGYLRVGIEDALQKRRENLRNGSHEVLRHPLREVAAGAEGAALRLPALVPHRVHERGGQQLHRRQREALDQRRLSGIRGGSHLRGRVPLKRENLGRQLHREGLERPARGGAHVGVQRATPRAGDGVLLGVESLLDARHSSEFCNGRAAKAGEESGDARGARASLGLGRGRRGVGHQLLDQRVRGEAEVGGERGERGSRDEASAVPELSERFQDELERRFPPRVARREGRRRAVAVERDERAAPVVLGPGLRGGFRGDDLVLDHLRERREDLRGLALGGVAGQRGARDGERGDADLFRDVARRDGDGGGRDVARDHRRDERGVIGLEHSLLRLGDVRRASLVGVVRGLRAHLRQVAEGRHAAAARFGEGRRGRRVSEGASRRGRALKEQISPAAAFRRVGTKRRTLWRSGRTRG